MIDKLLYLTTANTYPYRNLAIEEFLTLNVKEGECILYLWQNRHTVVIGKNQNCWKECKVAELEKDGGHLVRRLSGGGAVYHDMGNLNFTFCVKEKDYDLGRQLDVVLYAVKLLGIDASRTGRNDITVDGRKFSGNAFLHIGDRCYHHGTIMLNVNSGDMSKYLNVDMKKLQSKGVDSVRSRVANLKEFKPDITVAMMREALLNTFSRVYGLPVTKIDEKDLPEKNIALLTGKFESWDWKYGRKIPFNHEITERFEWGDVQMQLHVESGVIRDINLYSDAMAQNMISVFSRSLKGLKYDAEVMAKAISDTDIIKDDIASGDNSAEGLRLSSDIIAGMKSDIIALLRKNI